jgi:uncharacterized protein (TIGR01777 family)
MKIVIAGGSGFLGEPLVRRLQKRGDVVVLTRNPTHVRAGRAVTWNPPSTSGDWTSEIASADVVINLAGEGVAAQRWTDEYKKKLIDSRLDATTAIVRVLQQNPSPNRALINASAIGYYGPRDDEALDENAAAGSGFLAELTRKWEAAALEASDVARVALVRVGIVLAADGGALQKLLVPFRLFAGGPLGSGKQWMSWIDRDDLLKLFEFLVDHSSASGAYNGTAPNPVRNHDFARALGSALNRPSLIPAPETALRLAVGELAETLVTGQRVLPAKALAEGFVFDYPTLEQSLQHQLGQ